MLSSKILKKGGEVFFFILALNISVAVRSQTYI